MARSNAAWGIEIGQSALKALRCRAGDEPGQLVADAFDYIEYPKILSQPEADPVELVRDALTLFLSRNSVRGDRVAIAVPGQNGLARFIKLPPVESKKIPDIVRYEARQQIPFALEDVVWDYQRMAGGSVEEGFALETEVGLFAMKRDQVQRALKPLEDAGIEVDVVQLTPLALYNFAAFDQFDDLPAPEDYDPDDPPKSLVMLSLGTDTTDLVVTNGFRVWQRSIPIGGNHFTKALTKGMKLTFAKAEHLKRNAAAAEDPKAVFQAMREEFNNLLNEVQRSLGYFTNLDRKAKIGRIIGLGNAMKLPGLQSYLAKNLGQEMGRLERFRNLSGPGVVDAPAFKDNMLSFPVCYGLCIQALKQGKIATNLLPPEIAQDRMIRDKQPWAVATAAAILLGLTVSTLGYWWSWRTADVGDQGFGPAMGEAQSVAQESSRLVSDYKKASDEFEDLKSLGDKIAGAGKDRTEWAEFWHTLNTLLPSDPPDQNPPLPLDQRNQLFITDVKVVRTDNLASWYSAVKPFHQEIKIEEPAAEGEDAEGAEKGGHENEADAKVKQPGQAGPAPGGPAPGGPAPGGPARGRGQGRGPGRQQDRAQLIEGGPTGPGWVVHLSGFHFHNSDPANRGDLYIRNTFFKTLVQKATAAKKAAEATAGATRQDGVDGEADESNAKRSGPQAPPARPPVIATLGFPVLLNPGQIETNFVLRPAGAANDAPGTTQPRYAFEIEFCWEDKAQAATAGGGGGSSNRRGRGR